jgi:chaperonin GroES
MGSRVLVKRKKIEETTESGIILPNKVVEEKKETTGEVVATGTGERLDNGTLCTPDVKVGEIVLFSEFAGTEVLFGGEEYLLMSAGEILAVIE